MSASVEKQDKSLYEHIADSECLRYIHAVTDAIYIGGSIESYIARVSANQPDAHYYIDFSDPLLYVDLLFTAALIAYSSYNEKQKFEKHQQEQLDKNLHHPQKIEKEKLLAHDNKPISSDCGYHYFRDFLSGLKNGHHAVVNIGLLINIGAYAIVNPIGIACGAILCVNLVYIRKMNKTRKKQYQENIKLLEQEESFLQENVHHYASSQAIFNYVAVAFDALTDGSYLFGNALLIIALLGINVGTGGVVTLVFAGAIALMMVTSLICKIAEEAKTQRQFRIGELRALLKATDTENKTALQQELTDAEQGFLPSLKVYHYYVARAILSGVKNSHAAIMFVADIIAKLVYSAVAAVVIGIVGLVYTVFYTLYLVAMELYISYKKLGESSYSNSRYYTLSDTSNHLFVNKTGSPDNSEQSAHQPQDSADNGPLLVN